MLGEFGKIIGDSSDVMLIYITFYLSNILMCTLEIWAALAEVATPIRKLWVLKSAF